MKRLFDLLTAHWLMGTLLLFLAAVLGVATFIENDFGANASKALVYNTWWFELVFAILIINMLGNLAKYKSYSVKKIPVLAFHLSFLLILIGAAVTRYVGYEGMMHIREGEASDMILSSEQYVKAEVASGDHYEQDYDKVLFSTVSAYEYKQRFTTPSGTLKLHSETFIPNAMQRLVEKEGGKPALKLVVSANMGRQEVPLFQGEKITVGDIVVGFDAPANIACDVVICLVDGEPHFSSVAPASQMNMQTQAITALAADSLHPLYSSVLYSMGELRLVLTQYLDHAQVEPVSVDPKQSGGLPDAIKFVAELNDEVKEFYVFGRPGQLGQDYVQSIGGVEFKLSYGSRQVHIPFLIHLKKFELERYPGSQSPSSFASEVTLLDERNGVKEDKRIFMNNILNYKGFRFFQSSYDTDEKGTVLSVNSDFWGTWLTYLGYLILALGMIISLVAQNTRFRQLIKRTNDIYLQKKSLLTIMVLLLSIGSQAADLNPPHPVSKETAEAFGRLYVQDNGGRMKPLNSINNEVVVKLVKHNSFRGLTADQMVLSMMLDPEFWQEVPVITVTHPQLRGILQLKEKKASFDNFFTLDGQYKIHQNVEDAYRKQPAYRDKFEQEVVKVDEQINVFYMARIGNFLKIFPHPTDAAQSWHTPTETLVGFSSQDSLFAKNILSMYLEAIAQNKPDNAAAYVDAITKYQTKYGSAITPSAFKRDVEIFYNKTNLFMSLSPYFMVLGLVLLILQLIRLVKPKWQFSIALKIGLGLVLFAFVLYTVGLGIRWYISGHAPWSNGYESMLYIGWCTLLAGLVFSKRSPISLAVTALFGGVILMVAHLSWMNPEITNLVPVLKSYWLTIHVAIIVASYGFFSLAALLSFLNLILTGAKTPINSKAFTLSVEELSAISEMAITIGLYLLTIGAFLGGIWANESWGRYWGWDPKETWSAVTIIIYAFILHMRFIPGLKGTTTFNFWSVIGFSSVIMTYLGVNYYLAGMHSYGKGDSLPIPTFVYYTVAVVAVVSIYAFYNDKKMQPLVEDNAVDSDK